KARSTQIVFLPEPAELDGERASFLFTLEPDEKKEIEVRIACHEESSAGNSLAVRFEDALQQRRCDIGRFESGWCTFSTSNELLSSLIRRSSADLTSLIQFAPEGTFIMAGIPWFATLFGRDSILTALYTLPFNPALTVGTLKTL